METLSQDYLPFNQIEMGIKRKASRSIKYKEQEEESIEAFDRWCSDLISRVRQSKLSHNDRPADCGAGKLRRSKENWQPEIVDCSKRFSLATEGISNGSISNIFMGDTRGALRWMSVISSSMWLTCIQWNSDEEYRSQKFIISFFLKLFLIFKIKFYL